MNIENEEGAPVDQYGNLEEIRQLEFPDELAEKRVSLGDLTLASQLEMVASKTVRQ